MPAAPDRLSAPANSSPPLASENSRYTGLTKPLLQRGMVFSEA